jgi:pentatricopeptide repeat protein
VVLLTSDIYTTVLSDVFQLKNSRDGYDNSGTVDPDIRKLSSKEVQRLIGYATQNRQYHRVIKIFQDYSNFITQSDGPQLVDGASAITTATLNCFLKALLHFGRMHEFEAALAFFQPSTNRLPDRRTYAILLRAYIQSLNLRKARLLLLDMITREIKIDSRIIRTVIQGEGELAISLESVDCLLKLLCSEEFEVRDMSCYNLIVNAYLCRDRPEKARVVLDEILTKGLHPDGGTFCALMRYQARKEGSAGVEAILSSMTKSGVEAELSHLNILVATLAKENSTDLRSASKIAASYGLVSDIVTCNIVLCALLRRKFDSVTLQEHFSEMRSLRIQPDAYTFTILLNEYKNKKGSWERTHELLLRQRTLNPSKVNRITNNVLIHYMISKFSESSANQSSKTNFLPTFRNQNQLLLQWDLRTLTNLIVSYSRCGEWSKIVDLFQKVQHRSVKLDRYFYRILVESLLRGRKYKYCYEAVSSLNSSDEILDHMFARECKIRISRTLYKNTGQGKSNLLRDIDVFLKYADEKGIMLSEKHCNLIAVALLDVHETRLSIELLESRYHRRGRFQDLDGGEMLGMSSWTILMRAYARKGSRGVPGVRSCISRSISSCTQHPSQSFLNFIRYLGRNEKLQSANPEDCAFFLETYRKHFDMKRKNQRSLSACGKGRANLTKTNIIMWVNVLHERGMKEPLSDKMEKQG